MCKLICTSVNENEASSLRCNLAPSNNVDLGAYYSLIIEMNETNNNIFYATMAVHLVFSQKKMMIKLQPIDIITK